MRVAVDLGRPREPRRARGGARGDPAGASSTRSGASATPSATGRGPTSAARWCEERCAIVLGGNHDFVVAGTLEIDSFSAAAREAAEWTQTVLSDESRAFLTRSRAGRSHRELRALPRQRPRPRVGVRPRRARARAPRCSSHRREIVLVGHSHVALAIGTEQGRLEGGLAPAATELLLRATGGVAPQSGLRRPAARRRSARRVAPARHRARARALQPRALRRGRDAEARCGPPGSRRRSRTGSAPAHEARPARSPWSSASPAAAAPAPSRRTVTTTAPLPPLPAAARRRSSRARPTPSQATSTAATAVPRRRGAARLRADAIAAINDHQRAGPLPGGRCSGASRRSRRRSPARRRRPSPHDNGKHKHEKKHGHGDGRG